MNFVIIHSSPLGANDKEALEEPLMKYIHGHLDQWAMVDVSDVFPDMDTVFMYISGLINEFVNHNKTYRKPAGFSLTYNKPSCCPSELVISFQKYSITIRKKHLKADPLPLAVARTFITVAMAASILFFSSCARELTGKQTVQKQQKEMMWKGYKKTVK